MYLYLFFWPVLHVLYNYCFGYGNPKLNRNFLSFYHSVVASLLTTGLLYNEDDNRISLNFNRFVDSYYNNQVSLLHIFYCFSVSYFIWDTFYIVFNRNWKELLYIYHHLTTILLLNELYLTENYVYVKVLHYGELSNIFTYIVYYLLHTRGYKLETTRYISKYIKSNDNFLINICQLFQFLGYLYIRVFIFTKILLFESGSVYNKSLLYNLFFIYVLGLIWTYKIGYGLAIKLI